MSIGLRLEGRRAASAPSQFVESAARWLAERTDDPKPRVRIETDDGRPLVVGELHPVAEPVVIEAPSEERVVLSASTGTAGPGYHVHVCELARAMGDALGIAWSLEGDETGWIATRDDAKLERAFLDWIRYVAERVIELADQGKRGFSIFMPEGHVFEHTGFVATALGPRDEAWLRGSAADPKHGIDLFPWWNRERDARYYRDLALAHMWLDVRWRAPINDHERELCDRIATYVERAHSLDAELDLPWEEQSEIFEYLNEESLRATRAHLKAERERHPLSKRAPIGYRRRHVRAMLSGGWSMRLDGSLAEKWEERGTFVAFDARRSVWFTSITVRTESGEPSPSTEDTLASLPPLTSGELLELQHGELRGAACFVEEEHEGKPVHRLEAHAAIGPNAAVGTLVFVDRSDRDWALETWASLAHV